MRIALGKVRDQVVAETNRGQEPFVYGSLGGAQIFLNIKEVNITINQDQQVAPNGQSEAAADCRTSATSPMPTFSTFSSRSMAATRSIACSPKRS